MSARKDLQNMIFGDVLVLSFHKQMNTHAQWKCLCMICNETFYVISPNLKSTQTNSCRSCAHKKTNYKQEYEIAERLNNGEKISHIVKDYNFGRFVISRIRDNSLFINRKN
ncbi:MAG: hypothetical protein JJW00_06285 [Sulfurimonas sp.]|nr:hypothetical protein [Sulfurimonas sp.]